MQAEETIGRQAAQIAGANQPPGKSFRHPSYSNHWSLGTGDLDFTIWAKASKGMRKAAPPTVSTRFRPRRFTATKVLLSARSIMDWNTQFLEKGQ